MINSPHSLKAPFWNLHEGLVFARIDIRLGIRGIPGNFAAIMNSHGIGQNLN
jgi:hypothetical protein